MSSDAGDAGHDWQEGGSNITVNNRSVYIGSRTHDYSAYIASKSAVKGVIPALAKEPDRHDIRVNTIGPGYTLTDMTKGYSDLEN